jgi:hypothetical protein
MIIFENLFFKEIGELKKERSEIKNDIEVMQSKMTFTSPVIVNVGGIKYTTSIGTLTGAKGSMLASMFSGCHKLTPNETEKDGSFFIDRDGVPFRYILNYLRNPSAFEPPGDAETRKEIKKEALFYCLQDLVNLLSPTITFSNGASGILDAAMQVTLAQMLPQFGPSAERPTLHLLCTSAQGTGVAVFDNATKGKNRILTVIKSTANHVFGAYIEDTFGQGGAWIPGSKENFLFALGNITGTPAKLMNSGVGNSVHITSCGLHCGNSGDLVAFCNSHSCANPATYKTWAPGFTAVPLSAGFLCGTSGNANYTPLLMEVYQVTYAN